MRKYYINNSKKILALLLLTAMVLPTVYDVKADSAVYEIEEDRDEIVIENDWEMADDGDDSFLEIVEEECEDGSESVVVQEDLDLDINDEESDVITDDILEDCETESDIITDEYDYDYYSEETVELTGNGNSDIEEECVSEDYSSDSNLSAQDKKERNIDAYKLFGFGEKLRKYLAVKYPDLDTDNNGEVSVAEMNNNNKYTTIEIKGDDYPTFSKNMVQFKELGEIANVDTIIIDGVDEVRNLFLPKGLKNLIIRNTTLNMYSDGALDSSVSYTWSNLRTFYDSTDVERFILDNVIIGNRFEYVDGDKEEVDDEGKSDSSDKYAKIYDIKISNWSKLKEFKINVGFLSSESALSFDTGEQLFPDMTTNEFSIIRNTLIGKIVVSSNDESFFARNYTTVKELPFEDSYFRNFLITKVGADINGDGFVTKAEADTVTDLTIDMSNVGTRYIDVMHNFNDLQNLENLQSLTIDWSRDSKQGAYISSIKFPDTGKLKRISITNTRTKFESLTVPSVETFIFSDNVDLLTNPRIEINDTRGEIKEVNTENSNISSLVIINGSAESRNLELNASNCNTLGTIEFKGSGYTLSGDVLLNECSNLSKIGSHEDGSTVWTVKGTFDDRTRVAFNIINCGNLCRADDISELILDYDISDHMNYLNIFAYGTNFSDDHKLTFANTLTYAGYILYCDDNSWLKNNYSENNSFEFQIASDKPSFAVFPVGNVLRKKALDEGDTSFKRWVDCYDVVIRMKYNDNVNRDQLNNFSNSLKYYVEDGGVTRNINYAGPVSFKIVDEDMGSIGANNDTFVPNKQGRAKVKVYLDEDTSDESKLLGETNIYIRSIVTDIELTNNSSELGAGTINDPIYIAKDKAEVSFSASNKYDGNYLMDTPDEIFWQFDVYQYGKYESTLNQYTTFAGIRVVDDEWSEDRINTRKFKFSKEGKFRLIAAAQTNKTDNSPNGKIMWKERYIEVVEPAVITASGDKIIHGSSGKDSLDISVAGSHHLDMTIKDLDKYSKFFTLKEDLKKSTSTKSVWNLSVRGNLSVEDNVALKKFIGDNKSITIIIKADGATYNKSFSLSSDWKYPTYINTLKYNANGGKGAPADKTVKVTYPNTQSKISVSTTKPTRAGYTFKGWYTAKTGGNKIGTTYTLGANKKTANQSATLYAQWQIVNYKITYKLNGGKNNSKNPSTYKVTTSDTTLKDPTRAGYTFKGWYTDSKFTKKITVIKKGTTGNKTIYAKWSANKYTIKYNANGGSGSMKNKSMTYDKKSKLTKNSFTRKNYTFLGWSTDKKAKSAKYKNQAEVKNLTNKSGGTVTLYAVWKKK